jgi:hypothetical protein
MRRRFLLVTTIILVGCAAAQQGPIPPDAGPDGVAVADAPPPADARLPDAPAPPDATPPPDAQEPPPDAQALADAAPPVPDAFVPPDAQPPPPDAPVPPDAFVPPDAPEPDAFVPPDATVDAVPCIPDTEMCDYIDNDCDDKIDEGYPPIDVVCIEGLGECETTGVTRCTANGLGTECNAEPPQAGPVDLCDTLEDEDCDGAVDEGYPDLHKLCSNGEGECQRFGVYVCNDEANGLDCDAVPGLPTEELCGNGKDENCNGVEDEGFPEVGQFCSVGMGECEAMGFTICTPDGTDTMCGALPGLPEAETCNGDDDDCDGVVDNGGGVYGPGGGAVCSTNNPGICGPGHMTCIEGTLSCKGDNPPSTLEPCNGLDDNCNGVPDDGWGIGNPCDTNDSDFCARGALACNPANPFAPAICVGDSPNTSELCNDFDDDCDGDVDENWNFFNDANNCGDCGLAANPDDFNHICSTNGIQLPAVCTSGACNPTCAFGRQSCDNNLVNGCEANRNTNPGCPGGYDPGGISGDVNNANVIRSGYGEARFRVRVSENSDWIRELTVGFLLTSPDGVNFDICVRCDSCGSTNFTCSSSTGRTDAVYVSNTDYGFGGDGQLRCLGRDLLHQRRSQLMQQLEPALRLRRLHPRRCCRSRLRLARLTSAYASLSDPHDTSHPPPSPPGVRAGELAKGGSSVSPDGHTAFPGKNFRNRDGWHSHNSV